MNDNEALGELIEAQKELANVIRAILETQTKHSKAIFFLGEWLVKVADALEQVSTNQEGAPTEDLRGQLAQQQEQLQALIDMQLPKGEGTDT